MEKPCPFCGREASVDISHGVVQIACNNDVCNVTVHTQRSEFLSIARSFWNTRPMVIKKLREQANKSAEDCATFFGISSELWITVENGDLKWQ